MPSHYLTSPANAGLCLIMAADPRQVLSARLQMGYSAGPSRGSPCGSTGKESACNAGFHPRVGKIPWRRERLPTLVFWRGEFHGLYSPWGGKESDTTERLSHLDSRILYRLVLSCAFFILERNSSLW